MPQTDPLTDSEKVDARRFTGYPAYGLGPNDDTLNRFFPAYYSLEYRLANMTDAELVVCRAYLVDIAAAQTALRGARATLLVDTAAVFIRNKNEMNERWNSDYRAQQRDFCAFLGIPPGPGLRNSGNTVRLVV
jgi:hypothetical protein